MSRPPRPINKRAVTLLSDGQARSVDELAEELGINVAEAYEVIRSLMKNKFIGVHSTVIRYGLNATGVRRSTDYKNADAVRPEVAEKLAKKREYMRKRRERAAEERPAARTSVRHAIDNQHPLAASWGRA